jgi:competence protein ComEC
MATYVLLVGPESSVIRAATMAIFVMVGLWIGRGTNPLAALSLAIIFLLSIDPGLAVDVGFGLSALATAGLLLLAPKLYQVLEPRMPKLLAMGVAATVSAQLYTLPIILYLQPSLPLYSVLANLLVEPLVAPITILGLLAVITIWLPPLSSLISYVASIGSNWIVVVATNLAPMPFVRLHFVEGPAGVLLASLFVAAISLFLSSHRPKLRTAAGFSLTAIIAIAGSWIATDLIRSESFAGDWEVFFCDVGQGDAALIRSAGRTMLIDLGPEPDELQSCLEKARVSSIDLVLLSHFDADHVRGVKALSNLPVGEIRVSGFQDDRPLVDLTREVAEQKGLTLTRTFEGMIGSLGEIDWQILAPSATAREAIDSNDASLVVLIESENYSILFLGDLGQSGQERLLRRNPRLLSQLAAKTLVTKVAHHGSADQSANLYRAIDSEILIFSVGKNDYGHPTNSALGLAWPSGAKVLRTDLLGHIALSFTSELRYRYSGKLTA